MNPPVCRQQNMPPICSRKTSRRQWNSNTSILIKSAGDIDQNGEINIADAILLARYIAEDNDISITEDGITAADLDADGYVTAMDQNKLLELIAHADL